MSNRGRPERDAELVEAAEDVVVAGADNFAEAAVVVLTTDLAPRRDSDSDFVPVVATNFRYLDVVGAVVEEVVVAASLGEEIPDEGFLAFEVVAAVETVG